MESSPQVDHSQATPNTTESPPPSALQHGTSAESQALQINFLWSKWKAHITKKNEPSAKPLYIINVKSFSNPLLTFISPFDNSTIGTGAIHAVSISPTCVVRGHPIRLRALKRLVTSYTHLSPAFSLDGVTPMPMTWTSHAGLHCWEFVCLDVNQMPVAKFSARWFGVKKLAYIEFLGEHALSEAVRDEIVVMGTTLYWGMVIRMNNPLNLVGSALLTTGDEKNKVEGKSESMKNDVAKNRDGKNGETDRTVDLR